MKKATLQERKSQAMAYMKQMDIYQPYIEEFDKKGQVTYFEHGFGYWVNENSELYKRIKDIENKYCLTVYTITHEYCEFGECFSMLYLSDRKGEWKNAVITEGKEHYAYAYVWNKTDDSCSEFGTVGVKSIYGGITRFA